MHKEFERPGDKEILDDREAAGLWKAIALTKEMGESQRPIGLSVILELHKKIFTDSMPEIAGRFRKAGEDVKKLACVEPPLGSGVPERIHAFGNDLEYKVVHMPEKPDPEHKKKYREWVLKLFELAAWTQHGIVAIHPFCEGNGRVARLMTNVVLRRFRMPPTDVKIESDDKPKYIKALCQIDNHSDYEPLRSLLFKGSIATLYKEIEKRQKKQATV